MGDKTAWRVKAKARRQQHDGVATARSESIVTHLHDWLSENVAATVVVVFDPLPGEVDLAPLHRSSELLNCNIEFALTRTPTAGFDLTVHPLDSELEHHRFGYRQPVAGARRIADSEIGVVLVPALAFDVSGNRLGFGAGYYDRFLARLPRANKIGIADYVVDGTLPNDDFDVPMSHLATAEGVRAVVR